ncbi:MAG: tyrosine-type recombinase/integrase [Ktedonobacteraceae bacterium]
MASPEENTAQKVRALLGEYEQFLAGKAQGTREAYLRTARQLIGWVAQLPGNGGQFQPSQLTQTAVEMYLVYLEQEGLSLHHRARVKSTISNFAHFLIEEKELLQRNPTRGIDLPPLPLAAPRLFSDEQRSILHALVKQAGDPRGAALFALGYWAGCRVSEVSWLQMAHTHVGPQVGWLHVGHDGSKWRNIDLMHEARQPLYAYLQARHDSQGIYVFTSQRSERLTEEGIYYWFRTLKAQGSRDQRAVIEDLSFNNLRHDFAQRARVARWLPEEVAYYLGQVTQQGMPALQTIVPSTPVNREQVKQKLNDIQG